MFRNVKKPLPKAFGGCPCDCHRMPGVYHVMACCGTETNQDDLEDINVPIPNVPDVDLGASDYLDSLDPFDD